ncbi:LysR family transcriptional regulator [Sulfitobacter sp. D35]|uniref:LysR family transcriptional regulator n=1 Tax=Sulfitobacter sp. D35 TaxID=3083252 RepID=UPI00296EF6BA|nr:LysR family transcriptional regulator [Sulfitobacter sp. D35]MDW4499336.1 LysR family transcriptional regulator [Sulfitobacter sp. D35]
MDVHKVTMVRRISELGNLSAAARDLGLSQPALTKILARLEDELGVRLFDRSPRGMVPTPSGQFFLSRMQRFEADMRSLTRDLAALNAGHGGEVSLGVGQFWLGRLLPAAIGRMARVAPNVRFRILAGSRSDSIARLMAGDVDLVLGRIADDMDGDLVGEAMADVGMSLVVREDHPLIRLGRPVRYEETNSYGWVLPADNDPTTQYAFVENGLPVPQAVVLTVAHSLTVAILQDTDYITVMPEIAGNRLPEGLCRLPADWLGWSRRAGVIRLRDRTLLPCCDTFVDQLRRVVREG